MKYLKKKRIYIFLICLISFITLTILVLKYDILGIDKTCYDFIKNNLIIESITPFIRLFTNLGGALVLIVLSLIISIFIKDKKLAIAIIINLIMAFLFNELLKYLIQRSRPDMSNWLTDVSGFSFPSGHSMVSMSYYGFLIYLIYLSELRKKWLLISLLSIIILLVGFSRMYLGVHYISDVLGGFLISLVYLCISITIYNYFIDSTHS